MRLRRAEVARSRCHASLFFLSPRGGDDDDVSASLLSFCRIAVDEKLASPLRELESCAVSGTSAPRCSARRAATCITENTAHGCQLAGLRRRVAECSVCLTSKNRKKLPSVRPEAVRKSHAINLLCSRDARDATRWNDAAVSLSRASLLGRPGSRVGTNAIPKGNCLARAFFIAARAFPPHGQVILVMADARAV